MKKLLITGINGMLGQNLVKDLLEHEVLLKIDDNLIRSKFRILWFLNWGVLIPYHMFTTGERVYIGPDTFTLLRNIVYARKVAKTLDLETETSTP